MLSNMSATKTEGGDARIGCILANRCWQKSQCCNTTQWKPPRPRASRRIQKEFGTGNPQFQGIFMDRCNQNSGRLHVQVGISYLSRRLDDISASKMPFLFSGLEVHIC